MTDFKKLLAEAQARFNALSEEEKREHRREQRRSFVRGQLMMSNPEMTKDEADDLIRRGEEHD